MPFEKKERAAVLEELRRETRTIVLYEAPHRLVRTLEDLKNVLGDRKLTICKELTKLHEQVLPTTLSEALALYETQDPRGEYVLVLEGQSRGEQQRKEQAAWQEITLEAHMQLYLEQGMERKDAMKAVARDRGIGKRDVYKQLLKEE